MNMGRREFLKTLVALSFAPSTVTGLARAPLGLDIESLELDEEEESPAGAWQVGFSTYPVIALGFEMEPKYVDLPGDMLSPVSRILIDQNYTLTLSLGGVYDLKYLRNIRSPFLVWVESGFAKSKDKLQVAIEGVGLISNIEIREPTEYEKKIVIGSRKVVQVQEVAISISRDFYIYYKEIKNG